VCFLSDSVSLMFWKTSILECPSLSHDWKFSTTVLLNKLSMPYLVSLLFLYSWFTCLMFSCCSRGLICSIQILLAFSWVPWLINLIPLLYLQSQILCFQPVPRVSQVLFEFFIWDVELFSSKISIWFWQGFLFLLNPSFIIFFILFSCLFELCFFQLVV
jgi:hypothetical protein